jgi:hypothetical protein
MPIHYVLSVPNSTAPTTNLPLINLSDDEHGKETVITNADCQVLSKMVIKKVGMCARSENGTTSSSNLPPTRLCLDPDGSISIGQSGQSSSTTSNTISDSTANSGTPTNSDGDSGSPIAGGTNSLPSSNAASNTQTQNRTMSPSPGSSSVGPSGQSTSGTITTPDLSQSTNGAGGFTMGGGNSAFNMFDHSKPSPFWISGQMNMITQYNPSFHAAYSGPNSFSSKNEGKTSIVTDLFLGCKFLPFLEGFLNIERFDGAGLSQAVGMGGLPNLDVVRNGPTLRGKFYIARCGLHAVIPLSKTMGDADRSPANLSTKLPERRLELRAGAFSAVDFFNYNSVGSDTHHQFMNWAICNDGWYDYPADTRGYTWGGMLEYQSPHFAARFLEAAMPIVANGESLVWRPSTTHSESYELEFRRKFIRNRPGIVRLLAFENHANMGYYQTAINDYYAGYSSSPNITSVGKPGTVKFGFGINCEQELLDGVTAFTR